MDNRQLAKMIRECFPQLKIHSLKHLAEGWTCSAVEVNGDYVFLFPKRHEVEPDFRKEIRLLPDLAKHLSVRVPSFDFVWDGDLRSPRPFVGYKKIEGTPLGRWCVRSRHAERIAARLSSILSEIHSYPIARARRLGIPLVGPRQLRVRFQKLYETVRKRVFPLLSPMERGKVTEFWEGTLGNKEHFRYSPVLIHSDLSGEHILCDRRTGEVNGIIDWTDATIGDAALDFAGILDDCSKAFAERVLAKYRGRADRRILERTRLYVMIVPYYEIIYGQDYDNLTLRFGLRRLRSSLR